MNETEFRMLAYFALMIAIARALRDEMAALDKRLDALERQFPH